MSYTISCTTTTLFTAKPSSRHVTMKDVGVYWAYDEGSIFRNEALSNILFHDMINPLYYEH